MRRHRRTVPPLSALPERFGGALAEVERPSPTHLAPSVDRLHPLDGRPLSSEVGVSPFA